MQDKIGFIGAGKMAEALLKGLLSFGVLKKKQLSLSDTDNERLDHIKKTYGVKITANNTEIAENSDIIIFSVKPTVIKDVLKEIRKSVNRKRLYISIAAGITTSFILTHLNKDVKLARVMPNTPCLLQEGICGIYFSEAMQQEDRNKVNEIFSSVGRTEIFTDESYMDAVTGLSGSGPAFAALFMESLADGGVKMGLSRESALRMAAQTLLGSARMVLEGDISPSQLKDMVSSPGGTTIEGIHTLEKNGVRNAVISAVEAATVKSREISAKGDD